MSSPYQPALSPSWAEGGGTQKYPLFWNAPSYGNTRPLIMSVHAPGHLSFPPYSMGTVCNLTHSKFALVSSQQEAHSSYPQLLTLIPIAFWPPFLVASKNFISMYPKPKVSHVPQNHLSSDFHTGITGSYLLLTDSEKCALSFDLSLSSANYT